MSNWALFNILLAFATGIIALISIGKHKDIDLQPYEKKKVYIAKSIAAEIGVVSCLVCLFSEQPAGEKLLLADRWTIILLFLLLGELMTYYFVNKKCHPKEWEDKTPDE